MSRHPGIYTIISNQIKCPGVFPGGGMVTPGIDSCITREQITSRLETPMPTTRFAVYKHDIRAQTAQSSKEGGGGGVDYKLFVVRYNYNYFKNML